ncbi:hypothetical protein P7K49_039757, partial [Saguinus oedipus]
EQRHSRAEFYWYFAEFYCYFSICGKNDGKACFEISPQKAFPDFPFHKRIYLCRILLLFPYMREYCFKGLFEIPPHKAFPHFPFNTRVSLSHEFNSLNKGAAEQIEGYFASVFKAEFYCYFAVCGNSAGKACFEISLQKAFPVFPFNTGVYSTSPSTNEFNSLNKGTAEQIEGYFASVFKAEQSFTAISQSFTAISLYSGILMKRPLNKCKAEHSFTAISLYSGILIKRPLNKGTAEQSFTAILNKRTADQIERYVASLNKCKAEHSFTAISLYSGILIKRPLNKGTAEQSFTGISLYAGILLERPLNKRTAEQIEEYVASLNKRTAEQIEGYVCSVFKAEFYCYFLNKGTAEQSFTAISVYAGILLERPLNKCKAEHQISSAISLYVGILLGRPLNKGTAEQSFTAISLYAGILPERTAEFYCYFLNKCKAEQSFTAISLYSGILIKRPLNQGTAEQIEGYDSSLNICKAERQNSSAISLYVGILLERPLNK